jgi:hypothetical protein
LTDASHHPCLAAQPIWASGGYGAQHQHQHQQQQQQQYPHMAALGLGAAAQPAATDAQQKEQLRLRAFRELAVYAAQMQLQMAADKLASQASLEMERLLEQQRTLVERERQLQHVVRAAVPAQGRGAAGAAPPALALWQRPCKPCDGQRRVVLAAAGGRPSESGACACVCGWWHALAAAG